MSKNIRISNNKNICIDDKASKYSKDKVWSIEKISKEFINNSQFKKSLDLKASNETVKDVESEIIKIEESKQNRSDSTLLTTNKNIVSGINEVFNKSNRTIDNIAPITSANKTWSIDKVSKNFIVNKKMDEELGKIEVKDTITNMCDEVQKISDKLEKDLFTNYETDKCLTINDSVNGFTGNMNVKGITYQNLVNLYPKMPFTTTVGINNYYVDEALSNLIKPNTTYTLFWNVTKIKDDNNASNVQISLGYSDKRGPFVADLKFDNLVNGGSTYKAGKLVFTTDNMTNCTGIGIRCPRYSTPITSEAQYKINSLILLEGDHSNDVAPLFFEGIESVGEREGKIILESCGKNMFDTNDITTYNLVVLGNEYKTTNVRGWIVVKNKRNKDMVISLDAKCKYLDKYRYLEFYSTNTTGKDMYQGWNVLSTRLFETEFQKIQCEFNDADKNIIIFLSAENEQEFTIKNIQFEAGSTSTSFEPFKNYLIEIPMTEPLRSLPNGVKDEITEDGKLIRRIGKVVLNGSETGWTQGNMTNTNFFEGYGFIPENCKDHSDCMNSNFIPNKSPTTNKEWTWITRDKKIAIFINKTKLSSPDIVGFKNWLEANPTTVYYELETPIITQLPVGSINLKTFEGVTNIIPQNYISPSLSFKVPKNSFSVNDESVNQIHLLCNAINELADTLENMRPILSGPSEDMPTNPIIGQSYFDRTKGIPLFWNGVGWMKADGMLPAKVLPTE